MLNVQFCIWCKLYIIQKTEALTFSVFFFFVKDFQFSWMSIDFKK